MLVCVMHCRFDCGQWLSRSEGDGSVERFLVAEKVPQTYRNSVNMAALDVESVLPSPGSRRRATSARKEEESGECECVCVCVCVSVSVCVCVCVCVCE